MEPALSWPAQSQAARREFADLQARTGRRPNIVWLLVDDMGYGDPGAFGGGATVGAATPNMDRLAREGLKLTSTYSQPTCTPTRSAILTGRLPVRTGLTRPILAGDKITRNPWADEVSLPNCFRPRDTSQFSRASGMWEQLPECDRTRLASTSSTAITRPKKEITQGVDKRRYPDLVLNPDRLAMLKKAGDSTGLIHGFKNGKTEEVRQIESIEAMAEADTDLTRYTVAKIKSLAAGSQPFFFEHAFMKVHADTFAAKAFEGKSASKYRTRTPCSKSTPISERSCRHWPMPAYSKTRSFS